MRFINEILHDKKVNDIDCTEDESAYIKGWLRDTIIKPEDGSQQVLEDIQLHFPLEYNEYLEEMELKDKPKDLIEWIDKVGLPSTKNIITELRALNAQREIISQQTNSVVSIEDAAVELESMKRSFYMNICRAYNAGKQSMNNQHQDAREKGEDHFNDRFISSHNYFLNEFPEFETNVP